MKSIKKQEIMQVIIWGMILIAVAGLALMLGSVRMGIRQVITGLFQGGNTVEAIIMRQIRLPRMLAGMLAGAGLALSGTLLQRVTDNGMASPNIIGVNAGAGFVMILMLYLMPTVALWRPLGAFLGAFGATMLIIWTASKIGSSRATIILAGMVFTTLLNAGISFVSLLDSDVLAMYNHFSVGSLAGIKTEELLIPAVIIGVAVIISLIMASGIRILCLGDDMAASLGVHVKRLRFLCLVCASAAAAGVVSFAGLLGFVGLIVPHIARRLAKGSMKQEIICALLMGGSLVILADTLGRVVLAPTEIPVGIVMALIGAPFFLAILLRRGDHA